MKKLLLSVISVILCLSLMVPAAVTAFAENPETSVTDTTVEQPEIPVDIDIDSALDFVKDTAEKFGDDFEALSSTSIKTVFMHSIAKIVNTLSNILITVLGKAINLFIPKTPALNSYKDFNLDDYENFFPGMEEFLDEPAAGARWSLGYAQESILPDDFGVVPYTMGGYGLMAETTETFDGLWVRTVILDDGSGRGKVAFCVLDAIGIANADVRLIRAAVKDFAEANNIVSINVSVTHTHSGIDLQGVWDNTVGNVLNNTVNNIAFVNSLEELFLDLSLLSCNQLSAVTDVSSSLRVVFADYKFNFLTCIFGQIFFVGIRNKTCRNENSNFFNDNGKSAIQNLCNFSFKHFLVIEGFFNTLIASVCSKSLVCEKNLSFSVVYF